MPLRIGVVKLQLLALKVLSNVMKKLCDEKTISMFDLAAVVSHIHKVPPPIQSEICRIFIEEFKKNNNISKTPLNEKHLFFCVHLNSDEVFMNEFERTLLFLNDFPGKHFKKLTFVGASFPFPENDIDQALRFRVFHPLYTFMSSLKNLTTFHAVRMCDDYMFQLFAECCPNLEEIEVELCYTVGDEGVSYLCGFDTSSEVESCIRSDSYTDRQKGCKKLKKIILDFTMVSTLSVAALLQFCPKLEILNVSPDVNIGEVFNMIHGYDLENINYEFITRKYNLITLKSYLELDESVLSLIVETCPRLQDIAIRCYGSERKDKNLLANLLNLSLNSFDVVNCNTESLLWFLSRKGDSISKLVIEHLITAPQTVFLNRSHLQFIIAACPNLTHFSLKMCGNVSISPNIPYSSFGNNLKYFTTLKDLYIEGVNLEPEDLKVLISHSKSIEDISLMCQSLEILEDALLYDLLSMGTLKKLKNFYAFRPFLTYAGLQRLLNECPHLEKVGPLSSWAIPKRERERLFYDIKKNNWQLNIESPETL